MLDILVIFKCAQDVHRNVHIEFGRIKINDGCEGKIINMNLIPVPYTFVNGQSASELHIIVGTYIIICAYRKQIDARPH